MNEQKVTGGAYGAIIGVSDIEKSREVYSGILGYDEIVYDKTGIFPDIADLPGGNKECRRVLLKRSKPFSGPFSKAFGQSVIELVSTPLLAKKLMKEGSGVTPVLSTSVTICTEWMS